MPEEIQHTSGEPEHPTVHFEPTDASLPAVLWTIAAALLLGVVVYFSVTALFHQTKNSLAEERRSRFPLAPMPTGSLPPEPRLEQLNRMVNDPSANIWIRGKSRLDVLKSYGRTEEKGFIHIPIDRAIRLLADKLPARKHADIMLGISAAQTVGLSAAAGPQVLLAGSALVPGREKLMRDALEQRQNGLLFGGEPNSGRLFNKRRPRWQER